MDASPLSAMETMKRSEKLKKVTSHHTKDLPDCVISYIFSKLSMKDLVKTSILSKRWLNEWGSRMDLNFDLYNMFDINTRQEFESFFNYSILKETFQPFVEVQSEFATRVDQFMLHYRGAKIHSLRVYFPLGHEHHDFIDRLILQGIAKCVEKLELLFSSKIVNGLLREIKPYKLSYSLLSDCDSLKHLHLQHCLLVPPIDIPGFKKLRTLVLDQVVVEQDLLQGLLASCFHLVDLTLKDCEFKSNLNITSPTISDLKIVDYAYDHRRVHPWMLDIITLNLSSFEYSGNHEIHSFNIEAPQLSKFKWDCLIMPPVEFSELKKLRTIVLGGILHLSDLLPCLFSECVQLEDVTFKYCTFTSNLNIISPTLHHLNIINCRFNRHLSWKINIDALNLSSFYYRGHIMKISSIKAPRLYKVALGAIHEKEIPSAFDLIASLHQLENLTMRIDHARIERLPNGLGLFNHLRRLELVIDRLYGPNDNLLWVLDIVMASPNLQKLFLTIGRPQLFENQRQRREHQGFSHNELKYVKLRGFAGNINEIELISHLLNNVNSLEQITFGHCSRFYMGDWLKDFDHSDWFSKARTLIQTMLEDEVNERCKLIFL